MEKMIKGRINGIIAIITIIGIVIAGRLVQLQIVKGGEYQLMSENRLIRNMPVKAARGEIFDRYGRPLVTNRMGFSVIFHNEYMTAVADKNKLILDVINVMEAAGGTYIDTLPLTRESPYSFTYDDAARESEFKKSFKFDDNMSAEDVAAALNKRYDVAADVATADARKIIGVRYEMERRQFSVRTPYTFATDVDMDVVSILKEQQNEFSGVEIIVEPIREYVNGSVAAHILGRIGPIYQDEYEELKNKNYSMNDLVGKDGIEKYLEDDLRGTDGVSSVSQSVDGTVTQMIESSPAIAGHYAVLTIDLELQKTLEKSLEETIKTIRNKPDSRDASAGAAVVIDVNTGEVLAMASYPTFDPAKFNENFNRLNTDKLRPMWNRAISGTYAPGSTFKALTAIAALGEGVVTPNSTVVDQGVYKYYDDYQPACWIWNQTHTTHGTVNAVKALQESCNYYFYDVGRRLTIEKLNKYGNAFGLGQKTGIELQGETEGIFASPEYAKKIGEPWRPGDTLQASIGQSYHIFTPIQIANYTSTIANGGTRYKPFLVKSVKSYTDAADGRDLQPQVASQIDMDSTTYKTVMDGLKAVSESGTASNVFANYRVSVGSKTGSASVPSGSANGIFIAFAPFDNPQIAIAVVVEHAGSGNAVAPIAKDVFDAYLDIKEVDDEIPVPNQLLR